MLSTHSHSVSKLTSTVSARKMGRSPLLAVLVALVALSGSCVAESHLRGHIAELNEQGLVGQGQGQGDCKEQRWAQHDRKLVVTTQQQIVCFDSFAAALVYTDEDKPVPNSLIEGWRYQRGPLGFPDASRSKINWYMLTPSFPPTLVGTDFPFSEFNSVYAGESKKSKVFPNIIHSQCALLTSSHVAVCLLIPSHLIRAAPVLWQSVLHHVLRRICKQNSVARALCPGFVPNHWQSTALGWSHCPARRVPFRGIGPTPPWRCSQRRRKRERRSLPSYHFRPGHLYLARHRQ